MVKGLAKSILASYLVQIIVVLFIVITRSSLQPLKEVGQAATAAAAAARNLSLFGQVGKYTIVIVRFTVQYELSKLPAQGCLQ